MPSETVHAVCFHTAFTVAQGCRPRQWVTECRRCAFTVSTQRQWLLSISPVSTLKPMCLVIMRQIASSQNRFEPLTHSGLIQRCLMLISNLDGSR